MLISIWNAKLAIQLYQTANKNNQSSEKIRMDQLKLEVTNVQSIQSC